jgi:hypothetical protein
MKTSLTRPLPFQQQLWKIEKDKKQILASLAG